ncbi:MAG: glycosyltransferase family 2 protein, partial [Albidovulum sp.]
MTELPRAPRTTIVTVSFNSLHVLPQMLASVPSGVPVVIVDNGSTDIAALVGLCEMHGATLIRNDRNLGFG